VDVDVDDDATVVATVVTVVTGAVGAEDGPPE
jgi:hypothetical protein